MILLLIKHRFYETNFCTNKPNFDTLLHLTVDDIKQIMEAEDELSRCGNFIRIFPTFKTHEYLQYFDDVLYYNIILDAWERKYYNQRQKGKFNVFNKVSFLTFRNFLLKE